MPVFMIACCRMTRKVLPATLFVFVDEDFFLVMW